MRSECEVQMMVRVTAGWLQVARLLSGLIYKSICSSAPRLLLPLVCCRDKNAVTVNQTNKPPRPRLDVTTDHTWLTWHNLGSWALVRCLDMSHSSLEIVTFTFKIG